VLFRINEIFSSRLSFITDQCQLMLYFSVTHKPQLKDKIQMHRLVRYQKLSHRCGMYWRLIIKT
jgi:hypothetical protein